MPPIHFNTAGAGLASPGTLKAMVTYLTSESEWGAYETEQLYVDALQKVRGSLVRLLAAPSSDHIALFDSGTRAWLTCVNALLPWRYGGKVWVTPYEYAGNLLALQNICARYSLEMQVIPMLDSGDLDLDWIAANADETLRFVSVVHVPSACGIVLPVVRIGQILRSASPQALYSVDACQSVGQIDLSCKDIGCDLLTAAGRKFLRGPRGTGFAYLSQRWLDRLGEHPIDLHSAEVISLNCRRISERTARRLELSEMHLAAVVGLGEAVDEAIRQDLSASRQIYRSLCEHLSVRDDITLLHPGTNHSGIVSFVHRTHSSREVVDYLHTKQINAWKISGSHTPLYFRSRGIDTAIRLSVHCTNVDSDLDLLDRALCELGTKPK